MTSHVAAPAFSPLHFRPQFSLPGEPHPRPSSMAALMQSNNEPVAISNPPDSVAFLKQSAKPESSLSSIASAGLNVSRARDHQPPSTTPTASTMASPATATTTATTTTAAPTTTATAIEMDRRSLDPQDRVVADAHHSSQAVAREALGASEKSHPSDAMALSSDQMQVDSHPNPGNPDHDTYGPPPTDTNSNAATATSLLNAPTTVASPGPMEESTSQDGDRPRPRDEADIADETSNKAFSYPIPTALGFNDARRGLSLPGSGFGRSPGQRSPGAKKHQCPYCATEFTRHHNLKSHLLTHSQEKPYVCQTCQSRFRRLHDLKRHTKLHTGERPHICPKCGRRFARGDALARHNKGQGGCAGRRSSMGSYVADDDYGDGHAHADDAMDGLVYAEPEPMHEEDERRLHAPPPSIRKHDTSSGDSSLSRSGTFHSRQPSTYPPVAAGRPSPGGLFPPLTGHGATSTSASPISQNGSHMTFPPAGQPSGASVFHPSSATDNNTNNSGSGNSNNNNNGNNLIESPKPLSPNALSSQPGPDHRTHSPLQQQQQQQQQQPFNRPPQIGLGLPPPQPGVPQLPPPPGMSSSDSRFALHTPGAVQPPATAARHTPSHSHSSNHSGGPLATKTGPETTAQSSNYPPYDPNMLESGSREDKLWSYIKSVHEELVSLRTEVSTLRNQLASNVTGPSLLEGQR